MVELSRDYTQDLLQDSIGEPIMEVTLEVSVAKFLVQRVFDNASLIIFFEVCLFDVVCFLVP